MKEPKQTWEWLTWYDNGNITELTEHTNITPHGIRSYACYANRIAYGVLLEKHRIVRVRLHYPVGLKLPYRALKINGNWGILKIEKNTKTLLLDTFVPAQIGVFPEILKINTIPLPKPI